MPPLPRSKPEFLPGENIILSDQGGFRQTHRAGWRPVECFLTNQRLIFFLRPEIRFQIPLQNILKLYDEKHYYVLKTRPTLRITYQGEKGSRAGKVLFITNKIPIWKKKIIHWNLSWVHLLRHGNCCLVSHLLQWCRHL